MDAPGGPNGGREFGPERDEPRLRRGQPAQVPGDGSLLAAPIGARQPELIGAEPPAPQSDFGGATVPAWTGSGAGASAPERCKFLRTIGSDGKLSDAGREAVPTHRCAAFGDPLPLSLRQQELVCLQTVHVSCPRYMRGTLLAEESAAAEAEKTPRAQMPWLTIAGLVLIALVGLVAIISMAGLLPGTGNGPAPTSSQVAVVPSDTASASEAQSPSAVVAESPTPVVTQSLSPSATPTVRATPSPTSRPTPTPSPTPKPTASWPPGATASRMNLLTPCVGQSNCWVYTVRSGAQNGSPGHTNDTVSGVANFFGVSASQIYSMNPWARSGITPGQKLKIPNPTR